MASKLSIIGLVILLLGFIPLFLFTFIGIPMFPFVIKGSTQTDTYNIADGQSRRVDLGPGVDGHPLPLNIKASYLIEYSSDYSGEAVLYLDSDNTDIGLGNRLRGDTFSGQGSGTTDTKRRSIQVLLLPPASAGSFTLYLEVDNTGADNFTIKDCYIQVTFSLYAWVFPGLAALAGLIITFIGLLQARKAPRVPRRPKVTPGWEPTLQWGSGAEAQTAERRPKMAIKSTKAAKPTKKKVVRRAAPTSGAQASCKFCGKSVSATAFFCPHCYGKLR